MDRSWTELYQLQDRALARIRGVDHGFYLTGGTALGRGYCRHRYSEDLDFFANDAVEFELWRDRCLAAISAGTIAEGKAAGVFPPLVAKALDDARQ